MPSLGFIILRCVRNELQGKFWKTAYESIRRFYPDNPILIIDDNSDYAFINREDERATYNTLFIQSEYPGRAELLPYIYYLQLKIADSVCFLHDSAFLNSRCLDMDVDTYKIFWCFEHFYDNVEEEKEILRALKNSDELLEFYDQKDLWKGCFGGMSVVNHSYLTMLNERYDLSRLLDHIYNREKRYRFERVISCILQASHRTDYLFGDIMAYNCWGVQYADIESYRHLPIIKTWATR
jgi:hypothetical protein